MWTRINFKTHKCQWEEDQDMGCILSDGKGEGKGGGNIHVDGDYG